MIAAIPAIIFGLAILFWSADYFVDGSVSLARRFGISSLLIGMVIVGFGTSSPEIVVSAMASFQGNSGIALGNAYGSNITNISLILGLTALIRPIGIKSSVLRRELPILTIVTALAAWQVRDNAITRMDALVLLAVFGAFMGLSILKGLRFSAGDCGNEIKVGLKIHPMSLRRAIFKITAGLILLIASSRILVWGAVEIAHIFGVSDLIIGLTIIAIGTSLPELASSIAATRKKEHDIALGNVIGSNLFNTLVVVGIAGTIQPMPAAHEVFSRDIPAMAFLTVSLFAFGYGFWDPGRINRFEGGFLMFCYIAYTAYLLSIAFCR